MGNMGYCRFRNTLNDLRDCEDVVEEEVEDDKEEKARKDLIKLCKRIAENNQV